MDRDEFYSSLYLAHHGVKGQKWGTRRYQNEDGSYKPGAEGRYDPDTGARNKPTRKEYKSEYKAAKKEYKSYKKAERNAKIKKAIGYGLAGAAVAGVAAYGLSKAMKSGAARIAAADGMKQYEKLINDGVINLAQGIDKSGAIQNRGRAIYDQITNGGASTKAATRSVLQYLGTGASMKSLPSADSLGRVQSTGELAVKAAAAQTKRGLKSAGSALKSAAGSVKDKVTSARSEDWEKRSAEIKRKAAVIARQMNHSAFDDGFYLEHHGVKGQKWGVRRYQNEDGSYTDLGAQRRKSGDKKGLSDGTKKALKIAGIAAGVAVAGYALHKIGSKKLGEYIDKPWIDHMKAIGNTELAKQARDEGLSRLKEDIKSKITGSGIKDKAKEFGKEAKAFTGKTIKQAGEAAASAAIASVGTIAVAKVADRYKDRAEDDEATRNANLIKRESSSAAIRSVTGSAAGRVGGNNNNNGSRRSASGKEFTDMLHNMVGTPARKHEWNGEYNTRYDKLMNGPLRNNDTLKADVKAMRHLEYSIDQIEDYVKKKGG